MFLKCASSKPSTSALMSFRFCVTPAAASRAAPVTVCGGGAASAACGGGAVSPPVAPAPPRAALIAATTLRFPSCVVARFQRARLKVRAGM